MGSAQNIKWTVILNPRAGGGKGKKDRRQIEQLLEVNGLSYSLLCTEYPKHAIELVKGAIEKGTRNIIVAGGDGTLNEVVNAIFQQDTCASEEITVGTIPVGTGNDWIKTFGIPNDYKGAALKIKEGKSIVQDIGKITFEQNELKRTRYFLNMAGFGFDAQVTLYANQLKEKGSAGLRVYLLSLLKAFWRYKSQKINLVIDGKKHEETIFTLSVGIGKFNGGGMQQAPNAVPNNGIFELTYIKEIGIWGILSNLVGLYKGTYIKDRRVVCHKARQISITSRNFIEAEADGESMEKNNFRIEIMPQKLKVIVGELQ